MGYTGKGEMVAVLWSLMPNGQREMMVAGFFMIIDARWANLRQINVGFFLSILRRRSKTIENNDLI